MNGKDGFKSNDCYCQLLSSLTRTGFCLTGSGMNKKIEAAAGRYENGCQTDYLLFLFISL